MGNINFDPELVQYIQGLYGDADLDNRTLKQLYTLWQTNPQIIKNAYQQKVNTTPIISQNNSPIVNQNNSLIESKAINTVPQRISKPEIADDDLSGISNFNDAFKEASQRGLKQFKWKSTKANPSGLFAVAFKTSNKNQQKPSDKLVEQKPSDKLTENSNENTISKKRRRPQSQEFVNKMLSLGMKWNPNTGYWFKPKVEQKPSKEEMEKSIFAKMGSKLDYISLLNGRCPEGYEVEKFLKGGCVKCRKKAMETNIFENKCGGKAKKRISKNK